MKVVKRTYQRRASSTPLALESPLELSFPMESILRT